MHSYQLGARSCPLSREIRCTQNRLTNEWQNPLRETNWFRKVLEKNMFNDIIRNLVRHAFDNHLKINLIESQWSCMTQFLNNTIFRSCYYYLQWSKKALVGIIFSYMGARVGAGNIVELTYVCTVPKWKKCTWMVRSFVTIQTIGALFAFPH